MPAATTPIARGTALTAAFSLLVVSLVGCSGATAASADRLESRDSIPQDFAPEGPRTVQAGAPGEGSRTLTAEERATLPRLPHTEADARFMQNMIHHHAQALRMASLVPGRTESRDIRLLADRIDRSQLDEIALMERWLQERGETAPEWRAHDGATGEPAHHDVDHDAAAAHHHAMHQDDEPLMAGMLTAEQFQELEAARGEDFDRLFLERMIFHHRGAIQMVSELFSMPGAGQDSEIFRFASHVESDQNIEIGRMERMLRDRR